LVTEASLKLDESWSGENGKSKSPAAFAVGWVSLVPTLLLALRSVAAIALLPRVRRVESTQPSGDAVALPSNETRTRVSVVGFAPGLAVNTRPRNVLTSDRESSSEPSCASIRASSYCCWWWSSSHDTVVWYA
jgi:hypothetical protein